MSITTCPTCDGDLHWDWAEAFDKFGFGDGDGLVMTESVAEVLQDAGYTVELVEWGLHNTIINSIKRDEAEKIPDTATVGYDDPRDYLPEDIIALLDERLGDDTEVQS